MEFIKVGIFALLALVLQSCKKDSSSGGDHMVNRVHTISDGNFFARTFIYDNQQRLIRIDYDAGSSLRLEYKDSGLLMQQYNGDTPDPERKYDLTLVNGRAVSGRQYLPGNKLNEYDYQYDNSNKLAAATIVLKTAGAEKERHYYRFHYDAQGDLAEMRFIKTENNQKTDFIVHAITYFTDKPFLRWADFGFDYFGSASFSLDNLGYGTYMPQLFGVDIRPRTHAWATLSIKNYSWNTSQAAWSQLGNTGTSSRNETAYVYDEKGRLTEADGLTVTWK